MKIDYDTEVPEKQRTGKRSLVNEKIIEFLQSKHKTMKIEFGTTNEARSKRQSIGTFAARKRLPIKVQLRGTSVYVTKDEEAKG